MDIMNLLLQADDSAALLDRNLLNSSKIFLMSAVSVMMRP